jgi:hypothetical protein
MTRSRILLALVLTLAAGAIAGCGAGSIESAVDPVAQAADHTAGAGGVQIAMHLSMTAAGQTIPMDGSGVIDEQRRQGTFSMSFTAPGVGAVKMDAIMDGHVIYMRLPSTLGSAIPGGKPWMKLDLEKVGKAAGIDLGALQQSGGNDLGQYLAFLRGAGGARVVGTDTIRGVPTTHYAAYIDFSKAAGRLGGAAKKALQQVQSMVGVSSIPVDVWVDRHQLVRRMTMEFSTQTPIDLSMNMTMDVLRYHVPVDVTPPPADQVYDASSLAGLAGAKP